MSGLLAAESEAARAPARTARFVSAAWLCAAYTLFVVLFGAVVRITGSGAGCGQHWPTCHGEVAHVPRSVETVIELTHRVTSGVCLPLVIGLLVWSLRLFPRGHATRRYAAWAVVLMVVEALVGAGLVLLELVGADASAGRAGFMAVHLISTSLLMGAMALTAWTANHGVAGGRLRLRPADNDARWLAALLLGVVLISMLGAITALGDTLYPVGQAGLSERLGGAHFLQRLRIAHPITAVLLAVVIWARMSRHEAIAEGAESAPLDAAQELAAAAPSRLATAKWAGRVKALLALQVGVGVVNIALSAPGYMQVTHLAVGTLLWVSLVLTFATHLAQRDAVIK